MLTLAPKKTMPQVLCCECGIPIDSNASGMCVDCLQTKVDITEGISKQLVLNQCRGCDRVLTDVSKWVGCKLESRELLGVCLKKVRGMKAVKLIDAGFIWTEPHSRRLKVKLTVQKEAYHGIVLEQSLVVDYDVINQTCDVCTKQVSNMTWTAVVQLRQKVQHKRTFLMIEQLVLKHNAHRNCTKIDSVPDGLDFFFSTRSHARTFIDFAESIAPVTIKISKHLVSSDSHCNTQAYKYSFMAEIVPLCRDDLLVMPQKTADAMGMPVVALLNRINASTTVIDPFSMKWGELNTERYYRAPFVACLTSSYLTEFEVMDVHMTREGAADNKRFDMAEVEVVRSREVGVPGAAIFIVKSHLGRVLRCGDTVLGYDTAHCVFNDKDAKPLKGKPLPEIVLVKKTYPRYRMKNPNRLWKLEHLEMEEAVPMKKGERIRAEYDRELFMREIEEDPLLRKEVNIYKDSSAIKVKAVKRVKKMKKLHVKTSISFAEASGALTAGDAAEEDEEEGEAMEDSGAVTDGEADVEDDFPEIKLDEMMEELTLEEKLRVLKPGTALEASELGFEEGSVSAGSGMAGAVEDIDDLI